MKRLIIVFTISLLFNAFCQGTIIDTTIKVQTDSLTIIKKKYNDEISEFKSEIKKLKSVDLLEKVGLLILGTILGFLSSYFVIKIERKSALKKEFKSSYNTLNGLLESFSSECKNLPDLIKTPMPHSTNELISFFNAANVYYHNNENFTFGENISVEIMNKKEYFKNESLNTLVNEISKAIMLYNFLYRNKLNQNIDSIEDIIKKLKEKADNIGYT